MISDINNIEGYALPMEIVKDKNLNKENIASYDSFAEMLNDLYSGEIGAAFISSSYVSMFSSEEGLESIGTDTKVIYEKSKKAATKKATSDKTLSEPFTILLMGVDSDAGDLAKSNSFCLRSCCFNSNISFSFSSISSRDTRNS